MKPQVRSVVSVKQPFAPHGLIDIAVFCDHSDLRNYIEDLLRDEESLAALLEDPVELFTLEPKTVFRTLCCLDMKMGPASGEQVLEQLLNRWPRALHHYHHRISLTGKHAGNF